MTPAREVRVTMDKKYVIIERLEGGVVRDRDRINPDVRSKRIGIAKMIGVDDASLLAWIDTTRATASAGDARPQTYTVEATAPLQSEVLVRAFDQTDDQAAKYPLVVPGVLKDLLPKVGDNLLLKWDDPNVLCCLDIDYHDSGRAAPNETWLRTRVTADLAPRPFAWHVSKRGGLHLFYIASDPFTAEELAACAALCWRRIDPSSGVELKTSARGPGAKEVAFVPGEVQDTSALLRGWVDRTPADDAAAEEWRSAEEVEIGKRYGHKKCPINPTPKHDSTGDPVVVMDNGVFCHRCEGEGRSLGCRRPGFAPYPAITGGADAGELGEMLKNLCHWGHAKYILTRKYGMIESFARKAYAAALKAYHHGSQKALLVPMAFGDQIDKMTRVGGAWYNLDSFTPFIKDRINTLIERMPSVCALDDNNKPKADAAKVTLLMNPFDLTKHGYPLIDTIHGYRMKRQHLAEPTDTAVFESFSEESKKNGDRFLPQYVPGSKRNVDEAWGVLEEIFPGLDRKLVSLVMAAIGTAQETQLGMHPKLFIAGASGAAKTTTPNIAAAILGAHVSDFQFRSDEGRFGQQMYAAVKNSGLVMFNELIKDTERAARGRPITIREPFDPLLNVTPGAIPNVLHVGPRPYGRLPAFVITEPTLPLTLRDEVQIARRMWYWRVYGKKDWKDSWQAAGLSEAPYLRTVSVKVAQACDAIMSEVIDTYFARPMSWEEIADAHECQNIADSDEFEDLTPYLREFFRLLCEAPKIENRRLAERYPNGYKKIVRPALDEEAQSNSGGMPSSKTDDPLSQVYTMFADGRGAEWLSSRRLTEKDWSGILKTDDHVTLDLTNDGSNVYARFRVGRPNAPVKVNEKIIDPTNWEKKS